MSAKRGFRKVKREKELTISLESAEDQMQIFLDFYEIYPDEMSNEDQVKATETYYDRLISGIRSGRLEITAEGGLVITQTLKNKTKITYSELSGKAKVQDQKHGDNDSLPAMGSQRTFAVMASLANLPVSEILRFKGVDLSIVESLGFMLLNV